MTAPLDLIRGRQVLLYLTNKSGGSVAAGDVVVIDAANNDAFTTTTSAGFIGGIGVAQESIANNAQGRVCVEGYVSLVNVSASVTRGNFGRTHTVAKQAADVGAARTTGTFCQFLTGGMTPDARLFAPDLAPAAVSSVFKQTVRSGAGNYTTTSTSKTAIDATNLAYLTHTLAVGDVVRCMLAGQCEPDSSHVMGFDFEVDQPTSANVYIGNTNDYGVTLAGVSANRQSFCAVGHFVATEAGSHGFRPVWLTNAGTATLYNASSGVGDTLILFSVEKLGAPTP